jgi:tetratricopeptide (TPR) repeat protein
MRTMTPALALLVAALAGGTAAAQNADAEALFSEAERLETSGQLDQACDAFEASNRIEPRAGTMIRLGQCREKQGRLASAWSAYKDSLTRVKDPKKKAVAEAKVKELEPRLSYLTVLVPDESRVDGLVIKRNGAVLDPMLWNRAAPVDGGSYTISGEAPGHEPWTTSVQVEAEKAKASVEVPKFKELRKLVDPATPPVGEPEDDDAIVTDEPGMFTTKRKIALGLGGAGVVAAAAGVFLGLGAKDLSDQAFELCPDASTPCNDAAEAQDLNDRANDRALYANVAFGVAGAAVIGAAVLWFTGAPSPEESGGLAIQPRVGNGAASLDLSWRF